MGYNLNPNGASSTSYIGDTDSKPGTDEVNFSKILVQAEAVTINMNSEGTNHQLADSVSSIFLNLIMLKRYSRIFLLDLFYFWQQHLSYVYFHKIFDGEVLVMFYLTLLLQIFSHLSFNLKDFTNIARLLWLLRALIG